MKLLLLAIIVGIVGCQVPNVEKDKYYEQVRRLNERMLNGDTRLFAELDVWNREWKLTESSVEETDESVHISYKFKSLGATAGDECDDFLVGLQLHYRGCALDSLGYSYSFKISGSSFSGGAECDF